MTKSKTTRSGRKLGPRQPDPNQIAHRIISKIIEKTEADAPKKKTNKSK